MIRNYVAKNSLYSYMIQILDVDNGERIQGGYVNYTLA